MVEVDGDFALWVVIQDALALAFGSEASRPDTPWRIGTVKSNVGHLDAAAGVAGVIKTVLALEHDTLPASVEHGAPNPAIDFAGLGIEVNAQAQPWPRGERPRRAGVSSFGMGGTNAHAILDEAPLPEAGEPSSGWQLLPVSAETDTALDRRVQPLRTALATHQTLALSDVAWTLQGGRKAMAQRRVWVCRNRADALVALKRPRVTRRVDDPPSVVLAFPGQGSQFAGMARGLYDAAPRFRRTVEHCLEVLGDDPALRAALLDPKSPPPSQTSLVQPALFIAEYAIADLL